jgi:hypothetical protein
MNETAQPITRFTVFVPGDFPQHSYVRRVFIHRRTGEEIDPEEKIAEAFRQPGIIAQIVGPSKSGKTRAVQNCVGEKRLVGIAGSQIDSGSSLWPIVLRKLGIAFAKGRSKGRESKLKSEVKAGSSVGVVVAEVDLEASAGIERSKQKGISESFEVDPFQSAVNALKEKNLVLFLDDFHTIPERAQRSVAAQLKAAAQEGVKICLAEVPHHSDSTISALPDLTGRVQKIEFQYWSQSDLEQIGTVGFQKLGVRISGAALGAFAMEAAGSPQLMQLICLNAAAQVGIDAARDDGLILQFDLPSIRKVLLRAHGTVDRERIFSILDQGPDERGNPRNRYPMIVLGDGDNYEITLAAIALSPPASSLTWNGGSDNLLRRIDRVCTDHTTKPAKGQITRAIEQMQALAIKNLSNQPILEWSSSTGLQILDPYFIFFLRWSEKYEKVRDAVDNINPVNQKFEFAK